MVGQMVLRACYHMEMEVCKKWPFSCDDKQKYLSFQTKREGESDSNLLVVANYSEERIRLALARMIIIFGIFSVN